MKIEDINKLLGITESYQAPEVMMKKMMDRESRENLFKEFLKLETNLSYEWFQSYFEDEHADRKKKKQDFTPDSIAILLTRLTGQSNNYYEVAAGTGILVIKAWQDQRDVTHPFLYDPRSYWYQAEELSDRAIPFLIFNMAIRGMNGAVLHGDSLERKFKEIYFIRNDSDDFQAFSEVIKMSKSIELEKEYNVLEWID